MTTIVCTTPLTTVALADYQQAQAALCGKARNDSAIARGSADRNGPTLSKEWSERQHIHAAGAELAFATYSGRNWPASVDTYQRVGDVGPFEVKWSADHTRPLRVYPETPDGTPCVLVTGEWPIYTIRGWIWAEQGKHPFWWSDDNPDWRPCFLVPQNRLRAPEETKVAVFS